MDVPLVWDVVTIRTSIPDQKVQRAVCMAPFRMRYGVLM